MVLHQSKVVKKTSLLKICFLKEKRTRNGKTDGNGKQERGWERGWEQEMCLTRATPGTSY
jgi:hypothetical protein